MAIPHTTGGAATGKAFFEGRRPYVEELQRAVDGSNDNLVLILGPRRTGKTSIVLECFEKRNESSSDPGVYIYIYIPRIDDLVDFYKKSIDEIQRALKQYGKLQKFREIARLSKVKEIANAVRGSIGEIKAAGYGVSLKDADQWRQYTSMVATLRNEFISLILAFKNEKVVLGFDEVPEAIQHLLKNERGEQEVELWLEHFREIRHNSELRGLVNIILFGSVNMKLTLERINQSKVVNDAYHINVEPLDSKEVKTLFWDLVDTLGYKILEENRGVVDQFLDRAFTHCSPWAVQNFLDRLKPPKSSEGVGKALKSAYFDLFDIVGGVRYLEERLSDYYQKKDIKPLKELLKYLAKRHVDDGVEEIEDSELFDWFKKGVSSDIKRFRELMDILLLDNMIYREGHHYCIKNTVERFFWYERLVGPCKL